MLTFNKVTKFYRMKNGTRNYVLNNVSLEIPQCNLAVVGGNGAGKSTLLRLIGGAESPNSGEIITNGYPSWPLGLGVGFQGSLSGRENINFVCKINGLSKAETAQTIQYVHDFTELNDHFDNPIKNYSSGMRARLAFALSTAFAFDIYLIDELTSVGDASFREKANNAFQGIKNSGSIIYVSHSLDALKLNCDAVLFLKNGTVSYFEDIDDGIHEYRKFIHGDRIGRHKS